MKLLKTLITTRDNRLSSSKIAFWIFFIILSIRLIINGMNELTMQAVILLLAFLGYKGLKVWKMN